MASIYIYIYYIYMAVICPLTAVLDVTPICQGCYSCFHVPLASASQVPAEGSGSGRQRGCLTGAIASRVAGKTLGAAGLECFGQGSTLQQLWFILLIIWCWEHLLCNSGKLPLPVLKGSPRLFHTGSGATCSSYCLFLFGVCLLLKLISACVVAERAGSRGRDGLAFANDSCS